PASTTRVPPVVNSKSSPVDTTAAATKDPRMLVKQAREAYNAGHLEEAEKLARRADAGKARNWGLFEDSPEKLLSEIHRAKNKRDQEESVHVLAQAREEFQKGNLQEAKRLSYQAERLHHGPYNIWELGDRPQKLRSEIEVAENKERKNQIPPLPSGMAKKE